MSEPEYEHRSFRTISKSFGFSGKAGLKSIHPCGTLDQRLLPNDPVPLPLSVDTSLGVGLSVNEPICSELFVEGPVGSVVSMAWSDGSSAICPIIPLYVRISRPFSMPIECPPGK